MRSIISPSEPSLYAVIADNLPADCSSLWRVSGKFDISQLNREDLVTANRETEAVTGIPFIQKLWNDKAKRFLNS